MKEEFASAVPEIPVSSVDKAAEYYVSCLGFNKDWGDDAGGSLESPRGSAGCS